MESRPLTGRTALVTGGASGLGRATCLALAAAGAHVAAGDINVDGAEQTAALAAERGGSVAGVRFDVTDPASHREVLDRLWDERGDGFDILVNVAGIDRPGYFDDLTHDDFLLVNQVNYLGPVFLLNAFITDLQQRPRTRTAEILNVISISAITVGTGAVGYNSSKAAFAKATEIAAREVLDRGYPCRVQGIMPAAMNTPMMEQWGIPEHLMMDPAWVADEIVHAITRPARCYALNTIITPMTEPDWPR